MPLRLRSAIMLLLGIATHIACGDPLSPALGDFNLCTRGPIVSMEHGETSVDVECEVKDGMHLIAMPARSVSVGELTAIGLSETLAEIFASRTRDTSHWCAAEEFARDPNPPRDVSKIPVANTECISTEIEIDTPYQTRASRVRLVIERSSTGGAKLSLFDPKD
jgi:hypothetical protein